MKLECKIAVRYETSADQMRYLIAELRKLLLSHPQVLQDENIRVRFESFGEYALNIELFCYINTFRWYEYLAIREDILFHIMDTVREAGTTFAFPSRTVYQEPSKPLDVTTQKEKEGKVATLRNEGELPFPDFTPNHYEEFRGTIDYPPKGSISVPKNP